MIFLLAHWHIGILAHWHISTLAYWHIGILAYWHIDTLAHWLWAAKIRQNFKKRKRPAKAALNVFTTE